MLSSGSSRLAARAGRNDVGCSAMRAIRFICLLPPYRGRKVSQAGLPVKQSRVNEAFRPPTARQPNGGPPQHVESSRELGTLLLVGVTQRTRFPRKRVPAAGRVRWRRERAESCAGATASDQAREVPANGA